MPRASRAGGSKAARARAGAVGVFSSCYFVPIMNHFFLFFGWCAARLSTVSLTESGCPVGVEDLQDVRGGTRCVSTPDSACGWPLCEAVMVPCSGCSSACVLGAGRHPVPLTADAAAHRLTPPMPGRSPLSPFGFRARCQQLHAGAACRLSERMQVPERLEATRLLMAAHGCKGTLLTEDMTGRECRQSLLASFIDAHKALHP